MEVTEFPNKSSKITFAIAIFIHLYLYFGITHSSLPLFRTKIRIAGLSLLLLRRDLWYLHRPLSFHMLRQRFQACCGSLLAALSSFLPLPFVVRQAWVYVLLLSQLALSMHLYVARNPVIVIQLLL